MTATSKRSAGGMSTDSSKFSKGRSTELQRNLRTVKPNSNSSMPASRTRRTRSGHTSWILKSWATPRTILPRPTKCDQQYTTKVNRQFITLLHNAMFLAESKPTPAILRLKGLIDSSTVKGLMEGTGVGNEAQWDEDHMWLIPSVTIWARLCFKYRA